MKNHKLSFLLLLLTVLLYSCQKEEIIPEPNPEPEELSAEKMYFLEVAMDREFGGGTPRIKKWDTDLKIFLQNPADSVLVEEFEQILSEINALTTSIKLERVYSETEANYVIFFSDAETYADYERNASNFVEGNFGLFWLYWDGQCHINRGSMYVDIERTTDINCQKHLLREELTQSLGLSNDSNSYPESTFYQQWTCTTEYADIDKVLIGYILNDKIKAGMNREEVIAVLKDL